MRIRHDVPHAVRRIENVFIPLADGTRLAARIWLPETAEESPVPAILEYLPYRKRDFTRGRDEPMHAWFAGHGYAAVRVDLRGSGDSDGVLLDEYLPQEQEDALEVIAWLAARPWCTGAVGMMGISWGGFNALQVAARRPPALRAVLTLCASDDRYADDAHYMGGCVLNENTTWGSVLLAFQALPPDPAIVGEGWRDTWLQRLEALRLYPAEWLRHQRRDGYWRQGSVCEDFAAIDVPVYAIGGWADGYSNAVPRLLEGLPGPRKGLVGPWAHAFPHAGRPGPSIGFLQEALRWWDHWLRGRATGVMEEPAYRVWMQESVPPAPDYEVRPGRWVAEASWPSPRIDHRRWRLRRGGWIPDEGSPEARSPDARSEDLDPDPVLLSSPAFTGLMGGDWCAFGADGELPGDQRSDDGRSAVWDSAPLDGRLEILGAPAVELEVVSDRPVAHLAVRLSDVAPHGAATRVSYGLLNLAHRGSHSDPEPLVPGEPTRVRIVLNHIAHAFPPGHRMRIAVSTAYWPIAVPAPHPVHLSLRRGAVTLPVRPPRDEDARLPPFEEPEAASPLDHDVLRPTAYRRVIERDVAARETTYAILSDGGDYEGAAVARLPDIGLDVGHSILKRFRVRHDGSESAARIEQTVILRRPGWDVRVDVVTETTALPHAFRSTGDLVARHDDAVVLRRRWDEEIARDLV